MKMTICSAVFFVCLASLAGLARAEQAAPLPAVDTVLKRVIEQVEREEENERLFKQTYSFQRSKVTEFKNGSGEVKKTESKLKVNDPLKPKPAKVAPKPMTGRNSRPDRPVTETQSNVRGKAFEKSDFPIGEDLIARFEFTLVRREVVNGRPAFVIDFEPTKKKVPENGLKEKFLNKAAGRVWVDEADSVPVKADLRLSAPVSVLGGLVGAVQKFTFSFTRQRTPEGIWFTLDSDWHLEGREVFFRRIVDYHEETKEVKCVVPMGREQAARVEPPVVDASSAAP